MITSASRAAEPVPTPVPDRPLTVMDLADGAFTIMRLRPQTVAIVVAVFVLPTQLIASYLQRDVLASLSFDSLNDPNNASFQSPADVIGGSLISSALLYLTLPFVGVAITHLVKGWKDGTDRSAGECLIFTFRKTPTILAAFIISKLLQTITLTFATPFIASVAPIIGAEQAGPVTAVRRSVDLTKRRAGPMYGLWVLVVVVSTLVGAALGQLPNIMPLILGDWAWIGFFAATSLVGMVTNVFAVGTAVLAYFDLRNRLEGHDLSMRTQVLADAVRD